MKMGQATPTCGPKESTVFADVDTFDLRGVSLRVYDCAGQVAYTGLLQMFLTPRAVCVVVCDAGRFGERGGGAEARLGEGWDGGGCGGAEKQLKEDITKLKQLSVCDWLRSISWRVPQNDVILVATKCDLTRGRAAEFAGRMGVACQKWLEECVKADMAPVWLEDKVYQTSCAAAASNEQEEDNLGKRKRGESWGCDWPHVEAEKSLSLVDQFVNKRDGSGLRGAEMWLPESWDIALTVLEALEHKRDPVEAVMACSAKRSGVVESKTSENQGITKKALDESWKAVVDALSAHDIKVTNPDHALEGALCIRDFDGTVVRTEAYVFLDVIWLTRILKPLLNHRDTTWIGGEVCLGDAGETRIILTDRRHIAGWDRLKNDGILEPELARVMWPDLSEYVLPTLASLGLTFPLDLDPNKGLVVLVRLDEARPESVGKDIDAFVDNNSAAFHVCWEFLLGVPAGVIEKVLTRCCSIGAVQTFWRFGVLVRGKLNSSEGSGSFALVLEYRSDKNLLDMKAYGDICTVAPWAAISYAISTVRGIIVDFPGLRSQAYLECPEDGHGAPIGITTNGPGKELLEGYRCSRCSRETGGLGAAAVELVQKVDVQRVRGEVFSEVNARFECAQRVYSALCPPVSRDRLSEAFLSEGVKTEIKEYLKSLRSPAGSVGELHVKVDDLVRQVGRLEEGTKADKETLDDIATMIQRAQGDKVETPRQACILPGNYAEDGLTDHMRDPGQWMTKLAEFVASDFEVDKTTFKKNLRLFLVCARTNQLVPCGRDGKGYVIEITRNRVRVMLTVGKAVVEIASATVAAVFAAQGLGGIANGLMTGAMRGAATVSQSKLDKAISENQKGAADVPFGQVQVLEGSAYKILKRFVLEVECTARLKHTAARRKATKKGGESPSNSFVFFEDVMKKVHKETGGREARWELQNP